MSTLTTTDRPTYRGQKLALVVGYLAFAGGVLFAYGAPAMGYEVSIYRATPIGFWLGIGIALVISIFVTLYGTDGYVSLTGLALGGGAMLSVAGLPIIRNYLFYGSGDGLTHLGWTKDIYYGVMSVFADFYPGVHTSSLFIHAIVGTPIPRSMLLFVLACVLAYLVFIPLCVRSMTSHRGAMLLGGLSGLLLLPINHLGMNYMTPHPISDSIFMTPIIIYLLINYLTSPVDVFETRLPISAISAVFALTLGGIVLYHPQQAANLIIFFMALSFVQFVYRSLRPGSRIAEHRTMYGPTVFLIGSFMLWSVGRSRYESSVDAVLRELFSFLTGGGANFGAGVASQGASLTAIGGSVTELFLKLFGVSLIFAALAGLLMLTSLVGRLRDAPDTAALVKYFTIGLVVLIPYSLVFYIGSVSDLFFRNAGLIMLFSTILGSIALYRYISGLSEVVPAGGVRVVTAVAVVIMVVLSVVIIFPSPYIFLPNNQVTESQMDGYRFAFTHTEGDGRIYGLRTGPWRYKHGLFGVESIPVDKSGLGIPAKNFSDLAGVTAEDRYLAVTDAIRKRETQVYQGLRYDRGNFSALTNQPGVSLVYTNGQLDLYHIEGRGSAGVNGTIQTERETAGTAAATPAPTATPTPNSSIFATASDTPSARRTSTPPETQRPPPSPPTATATQTATVTPIPTATPIATASPTAPATTSDRTRPTTTGTTAGTTDRRPPNRGATGSGPPGRASGAAGETGDRGDIGGTTVDGGSVDEDGGGEGDGGERSIERTDVGSGRRNASGPSSESGAVTDPIENDRSIPNS